MFFRSLGAQAVLIEMNHLSSLTMGDEATASKYFSTPEGKKHQKMTQTKDEISKIQRI